MWGGLAEMEVELGEVEVELGEVELGKMEVEHGGVGRVCARLRMSLVEDVLD